MIRKKMFCLILASLMVVTATPVMNQKVYAAEDGLVLHLGFDGDVTDSSGNSNNGTSFGSITYEEGILGKAAVFDGQSYIEVKDADTLDLKDNFTISLWAYKVHNNGHFVPYVWKEKGAEGADLTPPPYKLYDHWTNKPCFFMNGKGMNQFDIDGEILDIGEWSLITVTYNGTEACMYSNGRMVKKESVTGSPTITTGNLNIGLADGKKFYYNGKMDDLRIYSRAISGQEVNDLYNAGVTSNPKLLVRENALVAHYKFEGDYKDSSTFGNHGELISEMGTASFVPGVKGKGIKLTGGSCIEVKNSDSLNFGKSFTALAWMYMDPSAADSKAPLLRRQYVSFSTKPTNIAFELVANATFMDYNYQPFKENVSLKSQRVSTKSSMKGLWTNVAITSNGKELRWYINGNMVKKVDIEDVDIANACGNLLIGSNGSNFFNGVLDDLKLYNYTLTSDDIKKEYAKIDSLSIQKGADKKIASLKVKGTQTLTVTRKYVETGKSVAIKNAVFKSSNTKIFKVDAKGKITALKKGTANLVISNGAISKTYKVVVK